MKMAGFAGFFENKALSRRRVTLKFTQRVHSLLGMLRGHKDMVMTKRCDHITGDPS